jgi:hypothetical protein
MHEVVNGLMYVLSSGCQWRAIPQFEANGQDDEQIHGGNVRRVVMRKSAPSLASRPRSLDHVFGDAGLSDAKPKLEQFAVDARTPQNGFPQRRGPLRRSIIRK